MAPTVNVLVWEEEGSLDVCASVGEELFVIERVVAGVSRRVDSTASLVVAETEGVVVVVAVVLVVGLADDLQDTDQERVNGMRKRDTHKVVDVGRAVDDRDEVVDSKLDWDTEMEEDIGMEMAEEEKGSVDDDTVGPTELPVLIVALTVGSIDPAPEVDVGGPWRARRESRLLWRTKEW